MAHIREHASAHSHPLTLLSHAYARTEKTQPEMSEQDKEFLKKYGKLPPKKGVAKKLLNKGGVRSPSAVALKLSP